MRLPVWRVRGSVNRAVQGKRIKNLAPPRRVAHAPSRAVFGALAEDSAQTRAAFRKCGCAGKAKFPARAPETAREGARATRRGEGPPARRQISVLTSGFARLRLTARFRCVCPAEQSLSEAGAEAAPEKVQKFRGRMWRRNTRASGGHPSGLHIGMCRLQQTSGLRRCRRMSAPERPVFSKDRASPSTPPSAPTKKFHATSL